MTTIAPFVYGSPAYDTSKVFYARLTGEVLKKDQLLNALYYLLGLPGYFGFNWDALDECLRDLSWIPEEKVVLVHDRLPKLSDDDLRIYLTVLRDSALSWVGDEVHSFDVVFKKSDEERILQLLE